MNAEALGGVVSAGAGVAEAVSAPAAAVGSVGETAGSVTQSVGSLTNFGKDMHMPSLNKGIFSYTTPVTSFASFPDRPVFSKDIFKETVPLAVSKDKNLSAEPVVPEAFTKAFEEPSNPDLISEAFYKAFEGKVEEAVETVVFEAPKNTIDEKEIRSDILEAVSEDIKLAEKVNELLLDSGVRPFEAKEITDKALEKALERKGIVLEEPKAQDESVKTEKVLELKKKEEEFKDEKEQKKFSKNPNQGKQEFIRDEFADEARRQDADQALEKVFEREEGKVKQGEEIASRMNSKPSLNEMSELALNLKQDDDGSYEEILKELRKQEFASKEEARQAVERLIFEKPAVKAGKGRVVGKEDVKRVLATFKAMSDPWFSQVAKELFI